MRSTVGSNWPLLLIVAAAFVAKLIVLLQLYDHPLLEPREGLDDAVYLDLARRVAGGDLVGGDRVYYVSPFYMYFSALVLALSGLSIFALRFAQIVLGTASVWLIADLARHWFGNRGAWIAATLAVFTGYFTFNEILILHSSVDVFLTAAGMWLLVRAWQEPALARFIAAGIVIGLHTLNRPNIGVWALAAVALTVARSGLRPPAQGPGKTSIAPAKPPNAFRRRATYGLALTAGVAMAMAPVAIRNYAVSGEFAPISTHGGLNLYIGNHDAADGLYREIPGISMTMNGQIRDMQEVAGKALGRTVTDIEASDWFYDRAWTWIREHPGRTIGLFFRKLGYLFSSEELPVNDSYAYYRDDELTLLRGLVVGPWLLLPFGLAGVWLGWPPKDDPVARAVWWRFCSAIAVFAISISIFFVVGRYRLPILVVACVTSAGAIVALSQAWRERHYRRLAGGLAVIVALGVFVNRPLAIDDGRAIWQGEMIVRHVEAGRAAAAEALLARIESSHPNPGLLHYRTGKAYASVANYTAAIPHFARALTLSPERKEIHLDLGHALVEGGVPHEALSHLKTALAAGVDVPVAALDLVKAHRALGDSTAALVDLRQMASESLDVRAASTVGRLALDLRDAPLAVRFLERATSLAPRDAANHAALGVALGLAGRQAEGLTALETAAQLDPNNASAHLNLAVAYASAGRYDDARREAKEAVRLKPDYERARELLRMLVRDHDQQRRQ